MPQQVELLASWRGQVDSHHNIEVCRTDPLCLMWYIWRERITRNFEDCERTVVELKAILLKTLYGWMATFNSSLFLIV